MKVRPGRQEDVEAVMTLIRRVVPLMQASGNRQWGVDYPDATVFGEDVVRGWLWLAEVEGQVAGVAAISTEQDPEYERVGWDFTEPAVVIHRLAVDPACRGMGVATALMGQAEALARSWGITALRVDTNLENEATGRLFPKLGYALAGEISIGFRPGLRFMCYEKRLI